MTKLSRLPAKQCKYIKPSALRTHLLGGRIGLHAHMVYACTKHNTAKAMTKLLHILCIAVKHTHSV